MECDNGIIEKRKLNVDDVIILIVFHQMIHHIDGIGGSG